MSEEELRKYYNIFTECGWKLLKNHAESVDDDAFWEALWVDAEQAVKNHGETEFAKQMVLLTIGEIERIHRKKFGKWEREVKSEN